MSVWCSRGFLPGHVIDKMGVRIEKDKVAVVSCWPQPISVKELRGFPGLAGYCRNFIKHFGSIAEPLTALLQKDSFCWTDQATHAFEELKLALCTAPLLVFPNFNLPSKLNVM